jgi:hypothetical protein
MLIWQGIQSFCEYRFLIYGPIIAHFSLEEDPRQKALTPSRTHLAGSEENQVIHIVPVNPDAAR